MSRSAFPRFRHVHFVGIGGVGMSGIAEVLLNLGHEVSGSDLSETATTRRLAELGATVRHGHSAENVTGADVVVTSSAVPAENPEVRRARELAVPVIPRAEMLAELMRLKQGIAVAGSHGKTTTTSLVAWVVAEAGLDPTIVIGGRVGKLGGSARLGRGELLVCEADESDGSFLKLSPTVAVVTNIDAEHLEAYDGSIENLRSAFVTFCNAVPFYGAAVLCLDDANVQAMLPGVERRIVTYGTSVQADVSLRDLEADSGGCRFVVVHHGEELGAVRLPVHGRHQALNSLAAVAVALELALPFDEIRHALESFEGVDRRMTVKGEASGVLVIDDYAHHPTELEATLRALQEACPGRRVVALFQPHRFSRVEALFEEFCRSFNRADAVLVLDVHAAGEAPRPGVTGERLAEGIRSHGHRATEHVGDPDSASRRAAQLVQTGDVVVTLGAGDVWRAGESLLERLADADGGSS